MEAKDIQIEALVISSTIDRRCASSQVPDNAQQRF